jgi:hypothetical protein
MEPLVTQLTAIELSVSRATVRSQALIDWARMSS